VDLKEKKPASGSIRCSTLLVDHPLSIELVGPHLKRLTPEEVCQDFGQLLAEFKRTDADVERNSSLLASLAFSTRRLSEAAQKALPWLGLFSGGVFEQVLLHVSQIPPAEWDAVRAELEATALIRVEREILLADRPYLRFHPTLAYACSAGVSPASSPSVPLGGRAGGGTPPELAAGDGRATSEIRPSFISVYLAVMQALDKALRGSQPRWGMEVLAREQANYRTAVRWAVADQAYDIASHLGHTFRDYLERSGRLRERSTWVSWLGNEVGKGGFTAQAADLERQQAWSLFTQGHPQDAIQKLEALVEHLHHTTEFDPTFRLALAQQGLGGVLNACGVSEQAIPVLEEAIRQWEALVEKKAGRFVVQLPLRNPPHPRPSGTSVIKRDQPVLLELEFRGAATPAFLPAAVRLVS
jgi:tetratricopeptide (TPR) repeat protein